MPAVQDLRGKLLAEAEQSARQNAAVAMRWADLFSIEVPQELYHEIEKQRQACERIISSKDKLIHGGCRDTEHPVRAKLCLSCQ